MYIWRMRSLVVTEAWRGSTSIRPHDPAQRREVLGAVGVVLGQHEHVGRDGLDQRPARFVVLLLEDQVDRALEGEQLETLHLRDHRPVLALAAADLLVAVDAHDEHVALLLGALPGT